MPALRKLSEEEKEWIESHFPGCSTKVVANYLKCDPKTARHILSELGLYKSNDRQSTKTSRFNPDSQYRIRKCLLCKKEKRLHKNIYICDACRNYQRSKGIL